MDRTGEWVFALSRDGIPFATRSLDCGAKLADDAVRQWQRSGYEVFVLRQPGKVTTDDRTS